MKERNVLASAVKSKGVKGESKMLEEPSVRKGKREET